MIDLGPEAVSARLRQLARLSSREPARVARLDMSRESVTERLQEACDLSSLCLELGACRPSPPENG